MSSLTSPETDESTSDWAFEYGGTSGRGGSLGETLGGGGTFEASMYSGAVLIGLVRALSYLKFW